MNELVKKAVKDTLHLWVDQEEPADIKALINILPDQYKQMIADVEASLEPGILAAQDKLIDSI